MLAKNYQASVIPWLTKLNVLQIRVADEMVFDTGETQ
jgi:hypothetical protein